MSARPFHLGCKTCQDSLPSLGRSCADCTAGAAKARGEPVIACVRFYPNGDYRLEDRVPGDVQSWLDHNARFRPGNSLFVSAECRNVGIGFSQADCDAIERCLASGRRWKPSSSRRPEAPSPQL
jgi:hypothetical protein